MKKPVLPRIAGLVVLYVGVFTALVVLQFSRQRSFNRHVGAMTVSGYYGASFTDDAGLDEFVPDGDLSIIFGGMEFRIAPSGSDFAFLHSDGTKGYPAISALALDGDSAVISFSEPDDQGAYLGLVFTSLVSSGGPGLRITASFKGDYTGAEIPFKPLRNARIRENLKDGNFTITAEGLDFSFGHSRLDTARRVLILNTEESAIVYRTISAEEGFAPENYVLPPAWTLDEYAAQVVQWQDQVFAAWTRTPTASLDSEELITAYITDAIHRGSYKEVIARLPRSFLDSARRTYISSVFLGRLDQGLRSLVVAERERASRTTLDGDPAEFLAEPHALAENAIRGNTAFVDQAVALLAGIEVTRLDLVPLILEACIDLATYRSGDKTGLSPLEPLVDPALQLVTEALRKDEAAGQVLVFTGGDPDDADLEDEPPIANTEFNMRLGAALDQYGRLAGLEDWAALGRSLILTVLAQTDTVAMIPSALTLSAEGAFNAVQENRLSAARFYRYLRLSNYPRAERIAGGINGWAWTASSAIDVTQNGDITDIAVTFPAGETHYIILRGLKPFTKVQLHGIDYRTDLQFERYDSSGWSYSAPDQSLLLKIKHRVPVEHIVVYTAPSPASPPPVPAPEALATE